MTRLADAAYRLLLRAFPAHTRAAFGDDMVCAFALQRRALAGRPVALTALWLRAAADAVRHGLAARWHHPGGIAAAPTRWLADLFQDLHYAVRMIRRTPGFTLLAVATLALGIGVNSAIFSVVHGVLRAPLPFPDADRLHRVRMRYPDGGAYTTLSAPDFMSVKERNRVFDRVEAYTSGVATLLGAGAPQEVRAASVSDGLLAMLDVPVVLGRPFASSDHRPPGRGVIILDHGFWQRAFGADPHVTTRSVTVGGASYVVIGVLARGARLPPDVPGARIPTNADVYMPLRYDEAFNAATTTRRSSRYLGVIGRARREVTPAQIDADLRRIGDELRSAFPESNDGLSVDAIGARELVVGDLRRPLLTLSAAVGFVLLVACANVASLLLARGSARRGELAVRMAIGAGRGRLRRQLLAEAIALGSIGGAAGLALAAFGVRILVAAGPADIPRLDSISIDVPVVLFTMGIAVGSSVLFGLVPALQTTARLTPALRAGGRGGGADRRTHRARAVLVVAEIALSVVLLTGAGLFIRSVAAMLRVDPAFDAAGAISFRVTIFGPGYDLARVRTAVGRLEEELVAIPGVSAVAVTSVLPVSGPGPRLAFSVEGAPAPPDVNPEIGVASVSADYFRVMGTPLVHGRSFTDRDHDQAALVAIVNQAAVRRWFPDRDPIGQRVQVSGVREIVGVAADVLQGDPRQPAVPQLFTPYAQRPTRTLSLVVRSKTDCLVDEASIRERVHRVDPNFAVADLRPLADLHAGALARSHFYTILLALFGVIALALAATGIFGVISYLVAERAGEISLRMALGARIADVLRMVLGVAAALAVAGIAIGSAAALAVGRILQGQLFGVRAVDPMTMSGVAVVLLSAALAASALPARRAARLTPADALKQ